MFDLDKKVAKEKPYSGNYDLNNDSSMSQELRTASQKLNLSGNKEHQIGHSNANKTGKIDTKTTTITTMSHRIRPIVSGRILGHKRDLLKG